MPYKSQKKAKLNFVESVFGDDYKRTTGGEEIRYDCPFCEEVRGKPDGDYKMYVNVYKLTYWCHKCHSAGKLRMDSGLESLLGESNSEVYNQLEEFLEMTSDKYNEEEYDWFKIPHKKLESNPRAYEYMLDRGISEEEVRYYGMRVGSYLNSRTFGRIVIPNVVKDFIWTDMYVARTYIGQEKRYLNPSASKSKGSVFNLHRIEDNPDRIIITEGVISGITAGKDAVSTYGKFVSNSQIYRIKKKEPRRIYIALDPDAKEESDQLCSRMKRIYNGEIYQVNLPEGKDPNDLGRDKFLEYLEESEEYTSKVYQMIINLGN